MLHRASLAALMFLMTAGVAVAETPEQQSLARGRQMAETVCARCHAVGATGESPHPPAPPFRTLSEKYPIDDIAEAFAEGVRVGHPDMPEFVLSPDEIDDLVAYLKSVQAQQGVCLDQDGDCR